MRSGINIKALVFVFGLATRLKRFVRVCVTLTWLILLQFCEDSLR